MTQTGTATAREAIPAVRDADAALIAHWAIRPSDLATPAAWKTWGAAHDTLARTRDAAERAHRAHICTRCNGRGVTQFRHRMGGVCFSCKGDGFTRAGRKAYTA